MSISKSFDSYSSSQDSRELFKSFLSRRKDRMEFKNNAERWQKNPWNYQRYMGLVKKCLKTIIKISKEMGIENQKKYTEEMLSRAHLIGEKPLGLIGEKCFQHRKSTVQAGNQLSSSFEELCMQLQIHARKKIYSGSIFDADAVAQDLNKFFNTWELFESQYHQDVDNARNYFATPAKIGESS